MGRRSLEYASLSEVAVYSLHTLYECDSRRPLEDRLHQNDGQVNGVCNWATYSDCDWSENMQLRSADEACETVDSG